MFVSGNFDGCTHLNRDGHMISNEDVIFEKSLQLNPSKFAFFSQALMHEKVDKLLKRVLIRGTLLTGLALKVTFL